MVTDPARHDPLQQAIEPFPLVILPEPSRVFLDRAKRLSALAQGHPLADWLSFLGRLTEAQHRLLQEYPGSSNPDGGAVAPAPGHHEPPILASSGPRDPAWQQALAGLANELAPRAPTLSQRTLDRLKTMDGPALEMLADRVLRLERDGPDIDAFPFVAAALQVHWTALAGRLDRTHLSPGDAPGACPCCGFSPMAAVVRARGAAARLRYLHCALCNAEWHLVRATCSACTDAGSIAYYHIEGSDGSVRAEACDACRTYLKIVSQEKSPEADPVADDLATLALDLLAEGEGYERMSPNLLFPRKSDIGPRKNHRGG